MSKSGAERANDDPKGKKAVEEEPIK